MSIINRTIIFFFSIFIFSTSFVSAEELKKIGKFKDWETLVLKKDNEIICFAQSKPVLQSPKGDKRDARLFVTFRPNEKISNEISVTSGYEYNNQNSMDRWFHDEENDILDTFHQINKEEENTDYNTFTESKKMDKKSISFYPSPVPLERHISAIHKCDPHPGLLPTLLYGKNIHNIYKKKSVGMGGGMGEGGGG